MEIKPDTEKPIAESRQPIPQIPASLRENTSSVNDDFLLKKINERREQDAFRQLRLPDGKIDFCSNDYLGIVKNRVVENLQTVRDGDDGRELDLSSGSTGSRLLTGNNAIIEAAESRIAAFHDAPAGLIFNSGYDANLGLLSCVPQRGDTILYDYLSHASLRDGIRLSAASAFSYLHNDLNDLERRLHQASGNKFVVTESVFSMDGDLAPLQELTRLCEAHHANLIVDEAHATGTIGGKGAGLVQMLNLQQNCFARIHTFGKACGAHGAIVLGSNNLRDYLINFSRPFIYTTALPPTSVATIMASYDIFPFYENERRHLRELISLFQSNAFNYELLRSNTAIQGVVIPGNERVRKVAQFLQDSGFDVRPILYPTVPKGKERLRIVLHSFNTFDDVIQLAEKLSSC